MKPMLKPLKGPWAMDLPHGLCRAPPMASRSGFLPCPGASQLGNPKNGGVKPS